MEDRSTTSSAICFEFLETSPEWYFRITKWGVFSPRFFPVSMFFLCHALHKDFDPFKQLEASIRGWQQACSVYAAAAT